MAELQYLFHYTMCVINFLDIFAEVNHPLAVGFGQCRRGCRTSRWVMLMDPLGPRDPRGKRSFDVLTDEGRLKLPPWQVIPGREVTSL